MALSNELQIGKAAEHLVCADLILQGYSAFLADQGLAYDVVLDGVSKLWRVQVKACLGPSLIKISSNTKTGEHTYGRNNTYRFGLQRSKTPQAFTVDLADIYAFVALDIRRIAYFKAEKLAKGNRIIRAIDLKSRIHNHPGRVYSNGTVRQGNWGRFFEDYEKVSL